MKYIIKDENEKKAYKTVLFGSDNVDIRNSIVRIKGVWVEFDANGNIIVDDKGLKKFKSMMQKISTENEGKKGGLFNSLKSKFSRSPKSEDENYKEIHDPIQIGGKVDGMPTGGRRINIVKNNVFKGSVKIGGTVNRKLTRGDSSSNETPIQIGCRVDGMPTGGSRINIVKDKVFKGPVEIGCSVNGKPTRGDSSSNETPSGSDFQGSQMGEE